MRSLAGTRFLRDLAGGCRPRRRGRVGTVGALGGAANHLGNGGRQRFRHHLQWQHERDRHPAGSATPGELYRVRLVAVPRLELRTVPVRAGRLHQRLCERLHLVFVPGLHDGQTAVIYTDANGNGQAVVAVAGVLPTAVVTVSNNYNPSDASQATLVNNGGTQTPCIGSC